MAPVDAGGGVWGTLGSFPSEAREGSRVSFTHRVRKWDALDGSVRDRVRFDAMSRDVTPGYARVTIIECDDTLDDRCRLVKKCVP